jgi:hypothetical protein
MRTRERPRGVPSQAAGSCVLSEFQPVAGKIAAKAPPALRVRRRSPAQHEFLLPTYEGREMALPARRPPPLARTIRKSVTGSGTPLS